MAVFTAALFSATLPLKFFHRLSTNQMNLTVSFTFKLIYLKARFEVPRSKKPNMRRSGKPRDDVIGGGPSKQVHLYFHRMTATSPSWTIIRV